MTEEEDRDWIIILYGKDGGIATVSDLTEERAKWLYRSLMPHTEPFETIGESLEDVLEMGLVNPLPDMGVSRIEFLHPTKSKPDPWEGIPRRTLDLTKFKEPVAAIKRGREARLVRKQQRLYYESLPWWKKLGTILGIIKPPTGFFS